MPTTIGAVLYYSDNNVTEGWVEELERLTVTAIDSIVGRIRSLEVDISDPLNSKENIYSSYRRIKLVESESNLVIFLGRVENTEPRYDENFGGVLKIFCVDYLRELFERKVDRDYSVNDENGNPWGAGKPKRSDLVKAIVTNYTFAGNIDLDIEDSGSTAVVPKARCDFRNSNKTAIQIIEEFAQEDPWDDALSGYGYDYCVSDTIPTPYFRYFQRNSIPPGGGSNGLTIQFEGIDAASVRTMLQDYSFTDTAKEIITRVTVQGIDKDGILRSQTATSTNLENAYKIVKEKVEYVTVREDQTANQMTQAQVEAYLLTRANALLGTQGGTTVRGEFSIVGYPYYTDWTGKVLVRVGDLVRIIIASKNINKDFRVIEVKYQEPPGIARMKVVSTDYGRTYSPYELTSVLQGLRSGQDSIVSSARFQDLWVDNAHIANASISKLLAGDLKVTGTITSGGQLISEDGNVIIDNAKIKLTGMAHPIQFAYGTTISNIFQGSSGDLIIVPDFTKFVEIHTGCWIPDRLIIPVDYLHDAKMFDSVSVSEDVTGQVV